jgi:DNA-binding SARP family transcriptional activator
VQSDGLLEFRILGPLEVVDGRDRVALGGDKQRATLAILLLNANRVVSVDRLADDLYAGAAPVTALKQVQRQISELRKALGSMSVIETRSPGYVIRLSPEQLDLRVFERLASDASEALSAGDPRHASHVLRQALDLWRGAPLADLTYESFARAPIERLEEIRLAALGQRIDADLALGRHSELAAELEQLVAEHPVRERFRAQLMLALYRSGRQAEAHMAYRQAREALMDGFGIEPGLELRRLQRQILAQDPSLELGPETEPQPANSGGAARTVLAVPADESGIARLAALADPLARAPEQDLIIARLVGSDHELGTALASLDSARRRGEGTIRVAAFTSTEPVSDLVRLASAYDVELVLIDAPPEIGAAQLPDELVTVLDQSPADVGMIAGAPVDWTRGDGIFVPFGGSEHDWAALELAGWLASTTAVPLRLIGARADPARGQRDASRLLANASLAVQRLVGVSGEPLLVDATADALVESVEAATLVVLGLSLRWRMEGVGTIRRSLLSARRPVVLVHRGPRPSGLAPRGARTRFSWSLGV